MDNNTFNTVLTERIEKIKAVLASKAIEYRSETDRLHNFKLAARLGPEIESSEKSL